MRGFTGAGTHGDEVLLGEQPEVHDWVFVRKLAEDQRNQRDDGNDRADKNDLRGEPVVLLAFVEHILQEANADNDETDADIVHSKARVEEFLQVHRVLHDAVRKRERKDANGHVDEEYPVPTVVIRNPTTECWTDGGRDDDRHSIDGKGHAALLSGEGVGQDSLFSGLQAATASSLQDAKDDKHGQARGHRAE